MSPKASSCVLAKDSYAKGDAAKKVMAKKSAVNTVVDVGKFFIAAEWTRSRADGDDLRSVQSCRTSDISDPNRLDCQGPIKSYGYETDRMVRLVQYPITR